MKQQRKENFLLGLATILFVALFILTFVFLQPLFKTDGRQIEIVFRHEGGMAPLQAGSPVRLAGAVHVGSVQQVRIEQRQLPNSEEPEQTVFVVDAEIDTDVPLYDNCRVTTSEPAIGGQGFVNIQSVGDPGKELTQPIIGESPSSFNAIIAELRDDLLGPGGLVENLQFALDPRAEDSAHRKILDILNELHTVATHVRTQVDPTKRDVLVTKLHQVLDDTKAMTAALRDELRTSAGDPVTVLDRVHKVLEHVDAGMLEASAILRENRPVVRDTLASVRESTRKIEEELLVDLQAEMDASDPASLLGKIHAAMDGVNAALGDVQAVTSESERLVTLSRPQVEAALNHLNAIGNNMEQFTIELILNPSKLIWGPGPRREEQMLVFQSARAFAQAARNLAAAAGRLDALLGRTTSQHELTEAERDEVRQVFESIQASFQRFEQAEQQLWDEMK